MSDLKDLIANPGRASAEDLAAAQTMALSGAEGIAEITRTLLMSPNTSTATKARIIANVKADIANASKLYGDREKLATLSKAQIESRLVDLLKKHNLVVPIAGINLHDRQDIKPVQEAG